ncbi:GFA family protein [Parendozoicomonas haliclonae]|uniref:Putative glutathione-dependent formaldehyde-activating enzyme n=2 Tax=Parendozoicomonas haliclonae TaxID=1960125 RepID=A0A1X7AR26_9GAMM|nr:GFA family protein [Parendozoicomonas haliclonae]SMA50781.1 putative glutathione-dependent formaldehyde-activating enzyme [Parendozoicomonas haliclonae]
MSEVRTATCHCGAIELSIQFDNGLENIRRCDCSLCSRKGYVMASVPVENLQVTKGQDTLSLYQWGTNVAEHYFCSQCGVYTHHRRRSNPKEYGVNIACLEGVHPLQYQNVPIGNGGMNDELPPLTNKA